jgi:antitoxin component of RelBE/YafQ-DinJ toxin-antitoxin module
MALKTFNVDETTYKKFSESCKSSGVSMSKLINMFMQSQIEHEPSVRKSYVKKIETLRKGRTIHIGTVKDFKKHFEIK